MKRIGASPASAMGSETINLLRAVVDDFDYLQRQLESRGEVVGNELRMLKHKYMNLLGGWLLENG